MRKVPDLNPEAERIGVVLFNLFAQTSADVKGSSQLLIRKEFN